MLQSTSKSTERIWNCISLWESFCRRHHIGRELTHYFLLFQMDKNPQQSHQCPPLVVPVPSIFPNWGFCLPLGLCDRRWKRKTSVISVAVDILLDIKLFFFDVINLTRHVIQLLKKIGVESVKIHLVFLITS